MAKGNKDKITLSFTRIERFLTKIAGPKIFEFEHLYKTAKPVKETSPAAKRQQSLIKQDSPRNVDRQKTRTGLANQTQITPIDRQKSEMRASHQESKIPRITSKNA